jgi:hypothetical protein
MEKQVYAMVKALKAFRTYVLHSKVIAYVPTSSVKDILVGSMDLAKKWYEEIHHWYEEIHHWYKEIHWYFSFSNGVRD